MRTSSRGEVDPFIVMDVMEAARAEEARGPHRSSTWRSASPARRRPRSPAPRSPRRWRRGRSATRWRSACRRCARGSRGFTATGTASTSTRPGSWSRPAPRRPSSSPSPASSTRGDRVAIGEPGYPSYRNILQGARPRARRASRPRLEDRFQPVPARPDRPDLAGVLVASPANPTGTMLADSELAALIERAAELGIAFVSDEIYHGIQYGAPRGLGARDLATRSTSSTPSRSTSR